MAGRGRAAAYDRRFVPALYDLDVRLTSRPLWGTSVADQVRFAQGAVEAAAGARLLDLPVGTGLVLGRALRRSAARPFTVAVDLSEGMLRRARARLGAGPALVLADVAHLPFRDSAFASVHSGNGFHVFPDRPVAARELARVLAVGATAHLTAWTARGNAPARTYQRLLARLGHVNGPVEPDDHARTFAAAGLVEESSTLGGTLLRWLGTRRL